MSRKKVVDIPKVFKTKEFESLKSKWYKKLEKSGFEDLEHSDENSPYLKHGSFQASMQFYTQEKETYYRLWTNYLSHNKIEDHKLNLVFSMHSEGETLTQITNLLKSRNFKKPKSIFWVQKTIHAKFAEVHKWNENHEEGLFYVGKPQLAWLEYKLGSRRDQ
jgi:hypothetical protein